MRKIICLILIALFFQIIGCKDQFENPTTNNPIAEEPISSFSTEFLEWEEALQDTSFQNLIAEFGSLDSGELILKGGKEKKKLKLKKSKVKKIKLGKNESFTIMIDSLDFSSLRFSNLLLTKNGDKEDAFIVKYYPERSWIASYIRGIKTDYKGKITFKKIKVDNYQIKSIDCD
ncbi:MAG: hypothetical protein GQ525_06060, partial [Draconibacterium sp.]|nr:hypothetical protein [Draconibacterium sp.]